MVKLTKGENARLRWLRKARAKDGGRLILHRLHVQDGCTMATDGFRLHCAETPQDLERVADEHDDDGYTFGLGSDLKASDTLVETYPAIGIGRYPDVPRIVPQTEPEAEFYVRADYLRQALDGMGGGPKSAVRIVVHGTHRPIEVYGKAKDGTTNAYALLMPLAARPFEGQLTWRPEPQKGE